jgi:hypothetical protein
MFYLGLRVKIFDLPFLPSFHGTMPRIAAGKGGGLNDAPASDTCQNIIKL